MLLRVDASAPRPDGMYQRGLSLEALLRSHAVLVVFVLRLGAQKPGRLGVQRGKPKVINELVFLEVGEAYNNK